MEELSERAKRVLGGAGDGSLTGDLTIALDMLEGALSIIQGDGLEFQIIGVLLRNREQSLSVVAREVDATPEAARKACQSLAVRGLLTFPPATIELVRLA